MTSRGSIATSVHMTKPIAIVSLEGSISFLRSTKPDAERCPCCIGPHIFSSAVELERGVSVSKFVNDFATLKRDGKPVFEGKRAASPWKSLSPEVGFTVQVAERQGTRPWIHAAFRTFRASLNVRSGGSMPRRATKLRQAAHWAQAAP